MEYEYGNESRGNRGGGYGGGQRRSGGFGGPRRESFSPVKVGEEMDVKIEAVGAQGDGIAKKNGFVLFVPGTKEGDNVRVRVTKVFRKMGFAEVVGEAGSPPSGGASEGEQSEGEQSEEGEEQTEDSEEF